MNLPEKEQRKHSRLTVDLEYSLIINDQTFFGHISCISLSGAYLATVKPQCPEPYRSKQGLLNVKTGSDWSELKCEIVYIGSYNKIFPRGMGVTFLQSDEITATTIWNLSIQYLQNNNLFAPL